MKNPVQLREAIDPIQNSLRASFSRCRTIIIPLAYGLACFALLPVARGVSPPPDGGYPNANTAEGTDALLNLSSGYGNTANGFDALFSNTTGKDNTANGASALFSNTTGDYNTANGLEALLNNTTGDYNTANGLDALAVNTTGSFNTASGASALFSNTTGSNNTATGVTALARNTTGSFNTASGASALFSNTTGSNNTATGYEALYSNTTANNSTATGYTALFTNTTGAGNTADGFAALYGNTTGNYNTANGYAALYGNTIGSYNTADGYAVLYGNTSGNYNMAVGFKALNSNSTGSSNVAQGYQALYGNTTGSNNIALGFAAGTNLTIGSNNIDIGNAGFAGESNTIRIGTSGTQTATYLAGIRGVAIASAQPVGVNANGQLGIRGSSARFKDAIRPMDKASEAILSLHPVSFRYKKELDPDSIPQFGLVAEEVAKVNPDLVARDQQGQPYTVRYEEVNAMLLNEFLKEHRKVAALEVKMTQQLSTNANQQKAIQALTAGLKEQASQIQKVSAQLAAASPPFGGLATSKVASPLVVSNQ